MYVDPGFGSMLIQVLIALIAGAGAYLVLIRKRIFSFFSSKKRGSEDKNKLSASDTNKTDDTRI